MKKNKRNNNKWKAERRLFANAYRRARARMRKARRLADLTRPEKPVDISRIDNFRYLRVNEDQIMGAEFWNIDVVTPVLLAPRFRAFVEGCERCGATSASYYDIDSDGNLVETKAITDVDDDASAAWEGWHKVLKKIQYAFDAMEVNTYGCHSSVLDGLSDAQKKRVEEGLLLFAKNYFALWY